MALKKADLMFTVYTRSIRSTPLYTEMVPDFARSNSGFGLRNEFSATHCLTIPESGAVEREFSSLFAASIGRVLVVG
jgi:hypothetical protein